MSKQIAEGAKPGSKRDAAWVAIAEQARAEGEFDGHAEMLVFGALTKRSVEDARELLQLASERILEKRPLPRIVALYIAHCLSEINRGVDPCQALNLRANARRQTST